MKAADLAALLARDAEGVARMLLPNGKREGHDWRAVSFAREPSTSSGVRQTPGFEAGQGIAPPRNWPKPSPAARAGVAFDDR